MPRLRRPGPSNVVANGTGLTRLTSLSLGRAAVASLWRARDVCLSKLIERRDVGLAESGFALSGWAPSHLSLRFPRDRKPFDRQSSSILTWGKPGLFTAAQGLA